MKTFSWTGQEVPTQKANFMVTLYVLSAFIGSFLGEKLAPKLRM